jgi:hypothetical protein
MSMTPREKAALDRWIMRGPPEPPEEEPEYCDSPGRSGCGACPGCDAWADEEYERLRERELMDRYEENKVR